MKNGHSMPGPCSKERDLAATGYDRSVGGAGVSQSINVGHGQPEKMAKTKMTFAFFGLGLP
jgi:hypothetical protein